MQPTLFDNDQPIAEGPSHPPCFYTMLARELLGAGDDWIVAQMECLNVSRGSDEIPPDKLQILLTGAVYPNKRGSKWGKPKNDSQRKIVVTEVQAALGSIDRQVQRVRRLRATFAWVESR